MHEKVVILLGENKNWGWDLSQEKHRETWEDMMLCARSNLEGREARVVESVCNNRSDLHALYEPLVSPRSP